MRERAQAVGWVREVTPPSRELNVGLSPGTDLSRRELPNQLSHPDTPVLGHLESTLKT